MADDKAKEPKDEKKADEKSAKAPEKKIKDVAANVASDDSAEDKPKTVRRSKKRTVTSGRIYVAAGFNNTLVTITDEDGNTIAWSSSGSAGFKGSKKSTPYASQMAAEAAAEKARSFGFEKADIYVKGVGHGREQALRGLIAQGITIKSIYDITPIPHNGCRKPRVRRN